MQFPELRSCKVRLWWERREVPLREHVVALCSDDRHILFINEANSIIFVF